MLRYLLVIQHSYGKSPCIIGQSYINAVWMVHFPWRCQSIRGYMCDCIHPIIWYRRQGRQGLIFCHGAVGNRSPLNKPRFPTCRSKEMWQTTSFSTTQGCCNFCIIWSHQVGPMNAQEKTNAIRPKLAKIEQEAGSSNAIYLNMHMYMYMIMYMIICISIYVI